MRQIDLRLAPGWSLEANLELRSRGRPDLAQKVGQDRIAARIAELAQLALQPTTGQLREGAQALAQIMLEPLQLCRPGLARTVCRRLQAPGDVSAHRLAVEPNFAGDRGNRHTLPMQFKDHDNLPQSDQRHAPPQKGAIIAHTGRSPPRVRRGPAQAQLTWGKFNRHIWGVFSRHSHSDLQRPAGNLASPSGTTLAPGSVSPE